MTPNLDQERVERAAKAIYEGRNGKGCKPWSLQTKAHKEPYLLDARAAITAYLGDTHVVVPREPTPEMLKAGFKQLGWTKNTENARSDAMEVYRAMLSASPTSNGKEG